MILCMKRREASQDAEGDRERLAVSQPGLRAEEKHAAPSEKRVAEQRGCEVGRHVLVAPDELGPGKGEEQRHGGPGAQLLWISEKSPEWDRKRVRERPKVAD